MQILQKVVIVIIIFFFSDLFSFFLYEHHRNTNLPSSLAPFETGWKRLSRYIKVIQKKKKYIII